MQTTITLYEQLAVVSYSVADYATAQAYLEKALATQIQGVGENHEHTAAILQELSALLRQTGKLPEGGKYLERAVAIRREIYGADDPRVANTLSLLGNACLGLKDFTDARTTFEQELTIRRQQSAANSSRLAPVLDSLAFVQGMLGKYAAAVEQYQEALEMRRQTLSDDDPAFVASYGALAIFAAAGGDWTAAVRNEDQSRRRALFHVTKILATMPERDQLRYLSEQDAGMLQAGLSLALKQAGSPEMAVISAGWVLNGKSLTEELLADRMIRARESNDPTLRSMAQQLAKVRGRQAQLTIAAKADDADPALRQELTQLASTEESLSFQLAQAGSKSLTGRHWIEIDELRLGTCADRSLYRHRAFPAARF